MSKTEDLQLEILGRLPNDFQKIVGKHSEHWNYSKLETLEKIADYLDELKEREWAAARDALEGEVWGKVRHDMSEELDKLAHPNIQVITDKGGLMIVEQIKDVQYAAPEMIRVILTTPNSEANKGGECE